MINSILYLNCLIFLPLQFPVRNTKMVLPPFLSKIELSDSDQSNPKHLSSDSSSSLSSRSFSSLYSQPSLLSVPSLSISSSQFEHLSNTYHHCVATLTGHSSYIFCLSLAGNYLYSGSSNGEIFVWDRNPSIQENYLAQNIVSQSCSAVKSIVILGDKLFSAHQDHRIRVWKIDNGMPNKKYKCIATLPTINDRCMKLFWTRNYVQVRRHKKCTWVHHVDTVSALALSKDSSLLYSASWDRSFKVWRTSDFKCIESVWNAHDDAINSIILSKNGQVYTGSADKKIKVWKKQEDKNHTLLATLEKHKSAVNALALSEDGSILYSGACDRSIVVWEKESSSASQMVVSGALRGHKKSILCLAVVSDLVCSGSADKTVRIWKRGFGKSYSCLAVFEGHSGPVKCLTAVLDSSIKDDSGSGNSYLVYSGSLDCYVKVWKFWVPNYL